MILLNGEVIVTETIGMRIKEARIKKGLSQTELAGKLGYKSRSSISKIETGGRDIPKSQVVKIAEILDLTPSYLMGWENSPAHIILSREKIHMIPVYNSIDAGFKTYDSSDISGHLPLYIENDSDVKNTICVTVREQSMSPKIEDGDTIVVHRQNHVDNGKIAIVMIGENTIVKRVDFNRDRLILTSYNPEYPPMIIEGSELTNVKVVGLVQQIIKII